MQKRSDETLVAYLDGELDSAERQHVEAWLAADPAARDQLAGLAQAGDLLRSAYAEIVNEPVPERLITAARGETSGAAVATPAAHEAEILVLKRPPRRIVMTVAAGRWGIGVAAAAGLFGLALGGAGSYVANGLLNSGNPAAEQRLAAAAANSTWLDNAAGYYKLVVSAGDSMLIDVPSSGDNGETLQKISQNLPQQVRLPDLKPWGLTFRGARLVVVEGKPAAQLVYTTDNKAIGPLTLVIGASKQPDIQPTFDRRQDVNLLYWRHQGRAYALVGQTDIGYLWGIANDVAWQLDGI
ncbi:MAG: anti-sigma factor [Alphaproteobacteria bacterium]|nr:anti-sigma factor [Alphaproteobacteria bacterium]MBV9153442.1 anti-sigma factor [Alphaproteobacteria bacterium]MBV9584929.1 anti-sigma factor [Alphaproteobacteria bacterium]MBV9964657.1 anti-sigma factor [Alphaproteobacteria bacterium]